MSRMEVTRKSGGRMSMYTGKIRQILLLTDGCSNQGEDPIAMAALAKEQGISVNVIGVMEQDVIDEKGLTEIEGIAMSGGGVSQIVYAQATLTNRSDGYAKSDDPNNPGCSKSRIAANSWSISDH